LDSGRAWPSSRPTSPRPEETVGHEFNDAGRLRAPGLPGLARGWRRRGGDHQRGRLRCDRSAGRERAAPLTRSRSSRSSRSREWASGDCFLARLRPRPRYEGGSAREWLAYGVACGAESTQHFGAGTLDPHEVERSPAEVEIRELDVPAGVFAEIDRRGALACEPLGSPRRAVSDGRHHNQAEWTLGDRTDSAACRNRVERDQGEPDLVPTPSSSRLEFSHPGGWIWRKIAAKLLPDDLRASARSTSERSTAFWSFELERRGRRRHGDRRRIGWSRWMGSRTGSQREVRELGVELDGDSLASRALDSNVSRVICNVSELGTDAVGGPVDFASRRDPPSPPRCRCAALSDIHSTLVIGG